MMLMQFGMHTAVALIKRDDPMTSDLAALVYLCHACHLLSIPVPGIEPGFMHQQPERMGLERMFYI